MKSTSKRIPFVCSAQTGSELQAGSKDVSSVYNLLIDSKFGNCESKGFHPIYDCASRSEFEKSLLALLNSWSIQDQLVFYFSGHGEFKREQYCLKFGENDLYPIKNLLNELEANGVSRAILIFDACHSAAVIGDKGFDGFDLENIQIPKGIALIASCRVTQVSQELSDGSSSVFTHLFCMGIQTGLGGKLTGSQFITVEDIVAYLCDELEKPEYQKYKQRPVYRTDKAEGVIWIAKNQGFIEKQDSEANQENIISNIFLSNNSHLSYDRQIVQLYTIEHLDNEMITSFLEQPLAKQELRRSGLLRASKQEHLGLMGLVKDNKPTLGAFLCFASKGLLADKYAACSLHLAVYSGNKRSSSTSSPDVRKDNLLNLFELGMEFFFNHAGLQRTGYIGTERRDDLEIPEIALREALANALVHRDYEDPKLKDQPTRIDVYSDRIEITSYGSLLGGITEKDLNENPEDLTPFRRNHIIADTFRIMQRVELNASGVSRMHELTKLANLSPPEIKIPKSQILKVIFFRPIDSHIGRRDSIRIPSNLPRSGVVDFVGREGKLKQIHAQLQQSDYIAITAITGIGGIGKTELALQYAYQHLEPTYPGGICWLKAKEDIGLQIVEFARLYAQLTPPVDWEIVEKVRWCWQQWWDELTLIVFDDVQNYSDIQPFLPPPKSQFRMLLTSRSKFPSPVQNYEIQVLSAAAAMQLLGSFQDVRQQIDADLANAGQICQWLGYLPLGLELVGRYLATKTDLTLAQVWERLQSQGLTAKALQAAETEMTATLGVIAAFELSWQELTPLGQELAARLSLFALAEMPWWLVKNCCSEWEQEELEDVRDRELLVASLLIRTREGMYELHQLLREFFALKLAQMHRRLELMTRFAQVLTETAKTIPQTVTLTKQANLIELIPHLTAATDFSQYLPDDDKTWCCTGLARFYQAQSQLSTAEFWYLKSLVISEEQLGANHPCTATSMNNLAGLYESIGRYAEAESLYVRSLAISEEQLGANHPNTATSLNNLAGLYKSTGKYAEAESLYVRSLAISEEQLGANSPATASSLNNLAELYRSMGKYVEIEPMYVRSLAIREKELGANHPDTATSLNNLAYLYESIGKYAEAEPLYVRSLAISEEQLGANHSATASSLNNLAGLYESIGRYAEAEPLYVRSLAISEEQLGTNHPATASSLNNLAGLYQSIGRYAEAEPLYVRSLAINEEQLGANHPATSTNLNNLAELYRVIGEYSKAEPLYLRSLVIMEEKLGSEHPDTATSLNNLALLYYAMNRYSEAEPLYARSLAVRELQLGSNHPGTSASLNNLALLYYAMNRYSEAESLYVRSLTILVQQLGAEHPNTQNTRKSLELLRSIITTKEQT